MRLPNLHTTPMGNLIKISLSEERLIFIANNKVRATF